MGSKTYAILMAENIVLRRALRDSHDALEQAVRSERLDDAIHRKASRALGSVRHSIGLSYRSRK